MGRKIIIAGQNETVRKTERQTDVDLATCGIIGCVGLLVMDKNGNASLTHVDSHTDLKFIEDEIKIMKGEYTIDVIKDENNTSYLPKKVLDFIKENHPKVKNSKGTNVVRNTKKQAAIVRDGKLFAPNPIFLQTKSIAGFPISHDNTFKDDTVETGNEYKDFQTRVYEQQLFAYFKPQESRKPDVVYSDEKWTESFQKLSEDIHSTVELLKINRANPVKLIQGISSVLTKKDEFDPQIFTTLPNMLTRMWDYQDKIARSIARSSVTVSRS